MIAKNAQNFSPCARVRKPALAILAAISLGSCLFLSTPIQAASSTGIMKVGLVIGASNNIVKASNFSSSAHFTWGAAEVSIAKAGYSVRQRLDATDDVFWFNAFNSDHNVKIGVSSSSGRIVSISAI